MIRRNILNIAILLTCIANLTGQDIVIGLTSNPVLKNISSRSAKSFSAETLTLPFFDDFSGSDVYPDPGKWSDDNVFINNTYSRDQITTGIATFDALDRTGRLYEAASPSTFRADVLTSQPVDLDFTPSDNIWLSFYYQPGGIGDIPEKMTP